MGKKVCIDTAIWCFVGAALGWIAGSVGGGISNSIKIENVLVGMFGAFIGAEFLSAMLHAKAAPELGFGVKLALAVASSAGLLALLWLMRRAVGPFRTDKKKAKRPY